MLPSLTLPLASAYYRLTLIPSFSLARAWPPSVRPLVRSGARAGRIASHRIASYLDVAERPTSGLLIQRRAAVNIHRDRRKSVAMEGIVIGNEQDLHSVSV